MMRAMNDRIIAACDGASKGNPGKAAWGWVAADAHGSPERWAAGPLGTATNNVAELTALEELLKATDPSVPLEVRMDSQYAMKAVTTWLPGWKRNGWRTSAGKPVANQELVVAIDTLLAGRDVTFVHVAAHQVGGDALNALADQAATDVAASQEAASSELGSPWPQPDPSRAAAPKARSKGGARTGTRKSGIGSGGSGRAISAKFPGRCACGRPYAAGEKIAKNGSSWGHPECREAVTAG
ncbi:ribonuclease H [Streptomyces albidoflavus]|uniref:ribonuclease H family protein n=1 Tax=Streptomyces albidoflavus TaxID=1886 RepID=UPI0004C7257A|nr:ribonuclease H [Streptomyces albidoflavus]